MSERSVKLKPDQPVRRYVGIDVTEAVDTVAFGHMWNASFGWRNLAWDLDRDPADNQRRIDKAHPKLPIKRLVRTLAGTTYADTCVMPEGIDGNAEASYQGADLAASDNFMHTFILSPSVDHAKSELNDAGSGAAADIIYLSSHGLHSGTMFGGSGLINTPGAWLFQLSVSASTGATFSGPGWLILSNCGTLDTPARADWLKLMSGTNPLRGIVGYQSTCPTAEGSVAFATVFIDRLSKGASIRNAWKQAVSTKVNAQAWVVLCHEEAKDDTIADWNASALKAVKSGSKILAFDDANPSGVEVVPATDPFEAFWSKGGTRITATNLLDPANHVNKGDTVTITVKPAPPATQFAAGATISIVLVYIRTDYRQNVDVTAMFDVVGQTGASAPSTSHTNTENPIGTGPDTWKFTVTGTPAQVVLTLKCKDLSMLHDVAMPLWLRVKIDTTSFDFIRNGAILER